MDVFRPELHSFALRAVLDEADCTLGTERVSQLLAEYHVTRERLADPRVWVSLAFYESLLDGLNQRANDPQLLSRAMLRSMSPKYLGPLYPLLFALGSPSFTYRQLPLTAARLNQTGRYALRARRRDFTRLAWVPLSAAPREAKSYLCLARRMLLERVPVSFELAPAEVEHEQCLLYGDRECVYDVRWSELRTPLGIAAGALGAFTGAACGVGLSDLTAAGVAAGMGAGAWALHRIWTLRGELRQRDRQAEEQRATLDQVIRENDALAEAKSRAEREVRERTQELHAIAQRLPPANNDAIERGADARSDRTNPERPMTAPLALIVVTEPSVRELVREAFFAKYRLRFAADASEAISIARGMQPDVVIADSSAAGGGFELCRELRAGDHTKGLPVVLLTASDPAQVRDGFQAGANDCVSLPCSPNELVARTELHVRLRRLTAQLARQERLAALGSLAASVAHNVRNPLSALISGLPAMRKRLAPHLDGATSELMDVMLDCAARIERMTLDLLDLSRIDRDSAGEFAPGSGLLAVTRMFAARLDGNKVELDTDVDVLAMASGRAGDVNHVFMNVIDNALRATDGTGRIAVRGAADAGFYVVTIGDSGPGIHEDERGQVFEPFWTTRAAGEGTGLGLSIARQIVEEHGGTIAAGHSPLGGAEFTIRLPLRRAERAA